MLYVLPVLSSLLQGIHLFQLFVVDGSLVSRYAGKLFEFIPELCVDTDLSVTDLILNSLESM